MTHSEKVCTTSPLFTKYTLVVFLDQFQPETVKGKAKRSRQETPADVIRARAPVARKSKAQPLQS